MKGKVKIDGTWRNISSAFVKVNGVWKSAKKTLVKVDGVFKESASGLNLKDLSWAEIAEISASGNAASVLKIGDEKDVVVNGETLTFQICGFNHDNLTSGGKAGITFGMKNLMNTSREMNASNTNVGGFTGSSLYTWLQNTLFPSLPADLRAVIKAVNKKTSAGNKSTTINTNSMKLFIYSLVEVNGTSTTAVYKDEGEPYPIFTDRYSRIKKMKDYNSAWWLRSPRTNSTNAFRYIDNSGYADSATSPSNNSRGVCFGFCI